MGITDEIMGKIRGEQAGEGGAPSSLLRGVMEMFSGGDSGGLHGLVQSFQQKGLGGIVSSWVGTGANQPIAPEQVREGLGPERMREVAARAGMSEEDASTHLSRHLPGFIDRLTPDGRVPEGGWLEKGMELLKGKFS